MNWRVGNAGHTVFGPNLGAPSPETIASVRKPENARVIAAAPELLRELKSAIFYIETYGGDVTASFAAGGNLAEVKALIARAEVTK